MKVYALFSLVFYALSPLSISRAKVADSEVVIAALPDAKCKTQFLEKSNREDTFDVGFRMTKDAFDNAESCIDSSRFRPTQIIKEDSQSIEFSNYLHLNQYWKAKFSKDSSIKNIFFQIIRFELPLGVTAAHTQYRVEFKNPRAVELTSQVSPKKTIYVNDVVVSFEAGRPADISYNFAKGAFNAYAFVGRVASGEQRLSEYGSEFVTESYKMQLPKVTDAMDLLLAGIKRSDRDQISRFYSTLWPNCTTEIFDLLDALPSMQTKQAKRFLTVLGTDPVAAPSIEALKQRGIFADTNLVNQNNSKSPGRLLADVPGHPFSLVLVTPDEDQSNDVEKALVQEVSNELRKSAPAIVQSIASAMILGEGNVTELLRAAIKGVFKSLLKNLPQLEEKLPPETNMQVSLYFTPWDTMYGLRLDPLESSGVLMRLPFDTFTVQRSASFWDLELGYRKVFLQKEVNQSPFNLLGVLAHLNIEKNNSSVNLQINGRLSPYEKAQSESIKTEQIELDKIEIPLMSGNDSQEEDQSIALITFSQKVNQKSPEMKIEFGPEGGIDSLSAGAHSGMYQVLKDENCHRATVVPKLTGKLSNKALGESTVGIFLNPFIKGNAAALNFYQIDFDFDTFKVSEVDVRVSSWPVGCTTIDSANEQVKNKANAQISKQLKILDNKNNDISKSLLNILFPSK